MLQPPVIVLPGITATGLEDHYPLDPETVWSAIRPRDYPRIALHPDDVRYEAQEPARVLPRSPFGLVYGDLVAALRHDLTRRADQPTPVFGFGYDWRQDCARTAQQLGAFVEEVLARTALLPHYRREPPTQVDLVGHSMGGLVLARYLAEVQDIPRTRRRVRRVVTLGTPFRGSMDSMLKIATGMGTLTGADPRDRERESARTIPALYQLLPSYAGAVEAEAGTSTDLFDIENWQKSVLETLEEFRKRQHAETSAAAMLESHLQRARDLVTVVNELEPRRALAGGLDDWLAIVGLGERTHQSVRLTRDRRGPRFEFVAPADASTPALSGDGTVPFRGACPDFMPVKRLACVTTRELSFWEIRDRVLVEFAGMHAFLPKMNLVQRLVLRFLNDDYRGRTEGRPAPGVTSPQWPAWLRPIAD